MPRIMPTATILSQGNEIVTGQLVDTNAAWLAERLFGLGFRVLGSASCGDDIEDIVRTLRNATAVSDLVISTGGLGPTEDDLTAEAVARLAGLEITFDAGAMAQVEAAFQRLSVPMSPTNRKQAMLPTGCEVIPNPRGTAPGFALEIDGALCCFLPGVPSEMKSMAAATVLPRAQRRWTLDEPRTATFRVAAAGESDLQQRLAGVDAMDERVQLGFRTYMIENHVKLLLPGERVDDDAVAAFERVRGEVRERLGNDCYSEDPDESLAAALGRLLLERGHTVTTAESCTGGLLAAEITSVSGSTGWFERAFVTYANEAKHEMLGVPEAMLAEHGAVSEPVVCAMADGARRAAGATWALALTGIAGPTGGTPEKPVGLVFAAVAGPDRTRARKLRLFRERDLNRRLSTQIALEMLRREMARLP
jgi:nicotinamide-nucleotide amidase